MGRLRLDELLAPTVVFTAALAAYLWTAPPGLTWAHDSADGGDLITAALVAGVAHPSGYPTYTLLARLATWLPWGTPAWRVTLLSVLSGALAAALTAAAVQDITAGHWPSAKATASSSRVSTAASALRGVSQPPATRHLPPALRPLSPIAAGLMLVFAPLLWSQATVAEVYALHACLAAALIWTLLRWQQSGAGGWAAAAGLLCGLALGNHLTIVWLAPLVLTWLLLGWRRHGSRWRPLAGFAGALALGLLTYLYLPLAAAGNPPLNWGNPTTWAGFWWLVSGELYRPYVLGTPWAAAWARSQALAVQAGREFLPWGVTLALLGVAISARRQRIAVAAALISLLLGLAWAITYNSGDAQWTLLPGWVLIAIAAGVGLDAVVRRLAATGRAGSLAAAMLCLAMVVTPFWHNASAQRASVRAGSTAEGFITHVLAEAAPNALVVTVGDQAIFSLWYARYGLGQRPDLIPVSRDLWGLSSYRATVAATHPQVAGAQPPVDWPAFVQQTARQRPVYLADARPRVVPPDLSALGLPAEAPFYLAPVPGSSVSGQLWRLQEVAVSRKLLSFRETAEPGELARTDGLW